MRKFASILVFVFTFIGLGNVWGQELTEKEEEKIQNHYFGSKNYWQSINLLKSGEQEKGRSLLEEVIQAFKVAENYEAYGRAHKSLVETYVSKDEIEVGAAIGRKAIAEMRKKGEDAWAYCYPIYSAMGLNYMNNYDYENSFVNMDTVILILENFTFKTSRELEKGVAYNRKGNLCSYFREFEIAKHCFQKTMEIGKSNLDDKEFRLLVGHAHTNFGTLWRRKGNLEKAIEDINKGLEIAISNYSSNSISLIGNYYSLMFVYGDLQANKEVIRICEKVIEIIDSSKTTSNHYHNVVKPETYTILGNAAMGIEDFQMAVDAYGKSYKILNENLDKNSFLMIRTVIGLANAAIELDNFELAKEYLSKADLQITAFAKAGDNRVNFLKHNRLNAKIKRAKKQEKWAEAIKLQQQALQLPPYIITDKQFNDIQSLSAIAELYLELNQLDSTILYCQKVMGVKIPNFNHLDLFSLPTASQIASPVDFTYILNLKAYTLQQLEEKEETEYSSELLYGAAIDAIDLFDTLHIKNMRKFNPTQGIKSEKMIANSIPIYQRGIELAANAHFLKKNIEKAFFYTQKMKAQQLWLSLLNNQAKKGNRVTNDLINKERDLLSEINYYEKELIEAKESKDSSTVKKIQNNQLLELNIQLAGLQREMEKQNSGYYEAKYNFVPTTATSLQELISDTDCFIEYALTDSSLYIFTLDANTPLSLLEIPLDTQTLQRINDYNSLLSNSIMARPASREKFIKLSHQLYQQFLAPIEKQLKDKKQLIIIGDGITNYIPFETLLKSNEIKPFKDLDFLVENHEISYHYSSTLFAKAKQKEQTKNEGIFAFAPVYDNESTTTITDLPRRDYAKMDSTLRAVTKEGHYSPLPESENEVKSIIKLFRKQDATVKHQLALRQDATEERLKANLEKTYRFVHIAGHSFADLENPKFSGIACYEQENMGSTATTNDGTLFTGEIYSISSQVDLVTLSSCESGFGKLEKTEGLLGLNRAFIYAGTPNVIFSLWKVYDKVSADLMVDFYKNVLDGEDYAASLRQAKLKLLEQEATASPHFWSPFLLIGR